MSKVKSLSTSLYWRVYVPIMQACVWLFHYLPVCRHKVVLMHDSGEAYGDSPKYLAEELLRRNPSYKLIWLAKDATVQAPSPIRTVRYNRIQAAYHLASAKIIITTQKARSSLRKKQSQFFLYVPHGQIGAKYVERQAGDNLSIDYQEGSKWHSAQCNLFLSSSKLFTEEMLTWYWYDGEVWESGLPRNDIFFNYTQEDLARIKQTAGVPDDVKIVFYAPTFRDNGNDRAYALDTERLLHTLEEKTGDKWILMIRLHPNFKWYRVPIFSYSDRVLNMTFYPDMQELLLISDFLISDYSSTMFDFNLMHRPVFLFTQDVKDYQKMRGLKDWFFRVPFPFCHNNDELCQAILDYDESAYQSRCKEFDKLYGSMEDGKATARIVDRLEKIMST